MIRETLSVTLQDLNSYDLSMTVMVHTWHFIL